MWRRASSHLQTLVPWRSALNLNRSVIAGEKALRNRVLNSGSSPSAFQRTAPLFSNQFSSESGAVLSNEKKRVEDVMPIATGHEREELEAELEGRRVLEIDYPEGPFGTKIMKRRDLDLHGQNVGYIDIYQLRKHLLSSSLTSTRELLGVLGVKARMSTMLFGFGWRKASLMNALCVLNISSWKW
ncbi:cytochrome c oxidase subunit 5b-1, mitochondrial-like isoform X1 [Macadamia integrifolia]|uniref:cytochrome c oxidase subunit 5b-1, mitochondrial-like isoform X1 n=1 Tax=Macadamia integrifolia TaxID=60698 RepID=UPI001C4E8A6C|nr:cytochrome c oxidase subunit 5b-1, mitochondrial-like isoform X1 [Macadamia integrifolia]